jgi:hypothetical protein
MSYNKGQGQSFRRAGLWNWDSQPFADGMLYVGCSRSTSAAGLKIFSSLDYLTLNKVDFQLLGVRPRMVQNPLPPPAGEQPAPTSTPDIGALRILSRAPTRPVTPAEPMDMDALLPTSTVPVDTESIPTRLPLNIPPALSLPTDTSVPPSPMDTLTPHTPRPYTGDDNGETQGNQTSTPRFFDWSVPVPLFEVAAPPPEPVEEERAATATEQSNGESEAPSTTSPPPPQPSTQNPPNPPTGGASSGRFYMRL